MINRYEQSNYYAHDLNISMKTSSGDLITMDFSNEKSSSLSYAKDAKSESASMSFSSMQSFQFSIDSNGIDAQDQKEIDAFMKKAKPYIDKFLKELNEDAPNTPVTKLAQKIASAFEPSHENSENKNNVIKTNIVKTFDNSLKEFKIPKQQSAENSIQKLFEEAKKLLEKTLKEFDNFDKNVYA